MTAEAADKSGLLRCSLCSAYFEQKEGYICPRCRKGPVCRSHRFPGRRECTSCVFEIKQGEISDLRRQEQGLKGFLRLLQFLFLVFSIFFIATRTGLSDVVEFMKENTIAEYLAYFGILPVLGYLLFYAILYNQRNKIKELESAMRSMEFKRMVK